MPSITANPTTSAQARLRGRHALTGVDSAQLDADLLLAHVLGCCREDLFAHPDRPMADAEMAAFDRCLGRRAGGEPLAYITGHKLWNGLDLEVGPGVLIPRPETETLVEIARDQGQARGVRSVIDVGTGSGAIAIALALALPIRVLATDLSGQALDVARRNVEKHGLTDRVMLIEADLLPAACEEPDMVVANLPYVPDGDAPTLAAEVLREPAQAIFGGSDGLREIARLLAEIGARGWPSTILLEIDPRQPGRLKELVVAQLPNHEVEFCPDLSGLERIAVVAARSAPAPASSTRD